MPYAANTDLYSKYGQEHIARITNPNTTSSTPDSAKVDSALEQATAEIDSYLSSCYATPVADPIPAILKFKAVDMAYYHLYTGCDENEAAEKKYNECLKWLDRLCCGECTLDIGLTRLDCSNFIRVSTKERIFTREDLEPYVLPRRLNVSQEQRNNYSY